MNPPPLSPSTAGLCGLLILLIPFAYAGLALMNSGLRRSRSAVHSLMASADRAGGRSLTGLRDLLKRDPGVSWEGGVRADRGVERIEARIGSGAIAFRRTGFRFRIGARIGGLFRDVRGGAGGGDSARGWRRALAAGRGRPFHRGSGGLDLSSLRSLGLGRRAGWRNSAARGFVDAGGAGTRFRWWADYRRFSVSFLHADGPPARGNFHRDLWMPMAIPGHNAVFVTFGAFLALIGWFGLANSSAATLFYGASAGADSC